MPHNKTAGNMQQTKQTNSAPQLNEKPYILLLGETAT